ncbi:PHB depolymerase family esterase [Actinoplanes sp. M2I2]|uniref:alpha/beta hydrolase family esterase n=1 Tax=Actinoplanes sp. M2I2 TaxID=1734444 RepID=UPI0020216337|nr:alpha/beta fold hydrolase [Actinoplanes sp. M2I2]
MAGYGRRTARIMTAAAAVMVAVACGSTDDASPPPSSPTALPASGTGTVEFGGRPVTVHVPASSDPARPAPLVIALHGFGSNPDELESYLRLTPESERRGFVYAYPEGATDDRGDRFWNATDACCVFTSAVPDDSRHLSELISTIQDTYRIDPARVYLIGHSNGGFMAHRMACDHAEQITAIVSLNAATWNDATRCRPSEPVGVLAVHSTADETVAFGGGVNGSATYPSAATTVARWRDHNGCAGAGSEASARDLVATLPGDETSVRAYTQGCAGGSSVQSWTINGGTHVPQLGPDFAPAVTEFLLSQVDPAR